MRAVVLSKKVFNDVRDFYNKKYKYETDIVRQNQFFLKLKPRLQNIVIDSVYKQKNEMFNHIFDGCSNSFRRQMLHKATFRYYSSKQEEDMRVNETNEIQMPVIDDAFQHSRNVYLIL